LSRGFSPGGAAKRLTRKMDYQYHVKVAAIVAAFVAAIQDTLMTLAPPPRSYARRLCAVLAGCAAALPALAHAPIMTCFENKDNSVTCEAGFSDGASARGSKILVMSLEQRLLQQGEVAADGTFTYIPPTEDLYEIRMVADDTHELTIISDEIVPFED